MLRREKDKIGNRRFLGQYDGFKYGWLKDTKKFIVLLIVLFIIFHNIIGFSFVKGNSMESTLEEGDLVVYTRINSQYHHGDVICRRRGDAGSAGAGRSSTACGRDVQS